MSSTPGISLIFNLVLFAYLCIDFSVSLLFDPKWNEKVPWDKVYDSSPVLAIVLSILIGLLLLLWGAKMVQLFWNRFISNIFELRLINFQEALALVLVSAIIVI